MLIHDLFFTETIPSFESKVQNKIVLQVNVDGARVNKGTINVDTLPIDLLKLLVPLVEKTVSNEKIKVTVIEKSQKQFHEKQKRQLSEKETELVTQYQRSLFNKKCKITALNNILARIMGRISNDTVEEATIVSLLANN